MKNKGILKKGLLAIVVVSMMASVIGCRSKKTEAPKVEVKKIDHTTPITLTIKSGSNGEATDLFAQEVKKRFNVTLIESNVDAQKWKLNLASGELPDIFDTSNMDEMKQMITGKLLLNMDNYMSAAPNMSKYGKVRTDYSRKNMSTDGKLYLAPIHGGADGSKRAVALASDPVGVYVRWDYYKELGSPVIDTPEKLLQLFVDMQKKHPKTEDGKKTYGMTHWSTWGDNGLWSVNNMGYESSYDNVSAYDKTMVLTKTGELKDKALTPDGAFWKNVKFMYEANRLGVLDPEGFTMKGGQATDKIKAGIAFSVSHPFNLVDLNKTIADKFGPEVGFGLLPLVFKNSYAAEGVPFEGGWKWGIGISSKTKEPERAMEIIDFMNSYEGARIIYSGIKGQEWDVTNGVVSVKTETLNSLANDKDYGKKTGLLSPVKWDHFVGLDSLLIDPNDNAQLDLLTTQETVVSKLTGFAKQYSKEMGVKYPADVINKYKAEKKIEAIKLDTNWQSLVEPASDDMKRIGVKFTEYAAKVLPKAVLAKSDEEFNKIMNDAIAEFKNIGVEGYNKYLVEQANKVKEEYKKMSAK